MNKLQIKLDLVDLLTYMKTLIPNTLRVLTNF